MDSDRGVDRSVSFYNRAGNTGLDWGVCRESHPSSTGTAVVLCQYRPTLSTILDVGA